MAVITISAAGGNWNATGTWVGGVVPVAADTILGVTGSGPLTVNVTSSIAGVDFSQGYTSTLTMNAPLTIGGTLASYAVKFSSGMTIAGGSATNIISLQGSAGLPGCSITSNGCVVPWLQFSVNTNQSFKTLLDNLTVTNFVHYTGNSNVILNGFQMNLTNYISSAAGGGGTARMNGNTIIRLNGANCSWNTSGTYNQYMPVGLPIVIDTPGTFTITGYMMTNPYGATGSGITYVQGTVTGDKNLRIQVPSLVSAVNTTYTLGLNGAGTWNEIAIANNTGVYTSTFDLLSNLNFSKMYIMPQSGGGQAVSIDAIPTATNRSPIIFRGAGALKGGEIYTSSQQLYQYPNNTAGTRISFVSEIRLTPGVTHSASYLSFIGGGTGNFNPVYVRSATGGTQATLNLTGDQAVFYSNFNDINASGGNTIYTYGGTASNSPNIQTITSYVPTSASTFVN